MKNGRSRLLKHLFVICAYKESAYLESCVESLINQTAKTGIIMVTSTDNAYIKMMAEKYNIELFVNDDGGIGKDWNFALDTARRHGADYATIAHQDDIYLEDYAKKLLEKLTLNSESLIAFSDYAELRNGEIVGQNRNLKIKKLMLEPIKVFKKNRFVRRRILSFGNPICCPAVTYNLRNLPSFAFNSEWKVSLDWLAWEEISKKKGRFEYIPKILMYHRIHEESETSKMIEENLRSKEDMAMFQKFWPELMVKILSKMYSKSEKENTL